MVGLHGFVRRTKTRRFGKRGVFVPTAAIVASNQIDYYQASA